MELGIYIHIPFCISKCIYCDFASFPNKLNMKEKYFVALEKEIDKRCENIDSDFEVTSIYFGGGTPSIVDTQFIRDILEKIKANIKVSENAEITIEINPKTLTIEKAKDYIDMGINRVSVGLQTHREDLLKILKRAHGFQDFLDTIQILNQVGFTNISADLIYGLPNQKLEDIKTSIEILKSLDIKHISYYSLTVMEGTELERLLDKGELELPDEDLNREMYHQGIEWLAENGYLQYEISNFANVGYSSNHNLKYWNLVPYLGFGVGAHSCFDHIRFGNTENIDEYIDMINNQTMPIVETEKISEDEEIYEYTILSLRLNEGLNIKKFKEKYNISIPKEYMEKFMKYKDLGLMNIEADVISLTTEGFDVSNYIFSELIKNN